MHGCKNADAAHDQKLGVLKLHDHDLQQHNTVVCKSLRPPSIFYLKYTINQFCSTYVIVCLFKVLH